MDLPCYCAWQRTSTGRSTGRGECWTTRTVWHWHIQGGLYGPRHTRHGKHPRCQVGASKLQITPMNGILILHPAFLNPTGDPKPAVQAYSSWSFKTASFPDELQLPTVRSGTTCDLSWDRGTCSDEVTGWGPLPRVSQVLCSSIFAPGV